jgi:PAS domain S-box-containing protein
MIKLLHPPVFEDEDKTLNARLLFAITWTFMLTGWIAMFIAVVLPETVGRWLILIAFIEGVGLVILALNAYGYTRAATNLLIGAIWVAATGMTLTGGGTRSNAMAVYLVAVVIAGLVQSGRAGAATAAFCSLTGLALVYLEYKGLLPKSRITHTPLTLWFAYTSYMAIIIVLQFLVSGTIRNALKQARREIKSRLQADEALRESEERFRSYVENVNDIVFTFSPEGILTYVSPTWKESLGHDVSEVEGRSFEAFVHPDDVSPCHAFIERTVATGRKQAGLEYRVRHKNGDWLWHTSNISPLRDADGVTISSLLGVARDITERKRAVEALRESEDRFRGMIEQSPLSTQVLSPTGEVIEVNEAFTKLWGVTMEDFKGYNFLKDKQLEAAGFMPIVRKAFAGEPATTPIVEYDARSTLGKGKRVVVQGVFYPVLDTEGAVRYVILVHLDFTARTRADEERKKLQEQLQQAQRMEAIGTLAGGIAHDFNNILTGIIGYTDLYINEVRDRPEVHHGMTQVLQAGNRAKDLITQILTFSRKTVREKIPITLGPIVNEIVKFMRASLPTTIEIRKHVEAVSGAVMADPSQMHQVLMNLCTNAGFAMKDTGGLLTIELRESAVAQENLDHHPTMKPGRYLQLTVRDTGYGISEENLGRIFDPYFTTKEKGEGTGLGLAVVDGIVKDHGGEIDVESKPGQGTVFRIYLPLMEQQSVEERKTADVLSLGRGERILFVDDEKIAVELSGEMFEKLNYRVTAERDPVQALELFRKDSGAFDLVITDKTMPHMTGFDLARAIRGIRADIPVLICSGLQEAGDQEKLAALGISRMLMKPIPMKVLAGAVRDILDGNGGTPETISI